METRKESLSTIKMCRFCLSQGDTLTTLYDRSRAPKNSVTLPLKILSCVSIEVFPSDKMPSYICNRCKFFMEISYEYKNMVRQADENILQFVQNGSPLKSMSWPQPLLKVFRANSKSTEVMKTVVESGAMVQVTAHESDSEEEDDENVYNIKIGDGSDEGSKSARIKVITSEKQKGKAKMKAGKGFSSVSKLTRHVREHAGERAYPCKYCNKSFIKSHHYTRHIRLKHRETIRTSRGPFGECDQYRCEQCEDSFATQDELIYHSAIHATQNLICPLCQEKFDDVDAVTAHIKSHVNGTEFMCDLCELVFTSKEKLDSHITMAHDDELRNDQDMDESSMEMEAEEDFEAGIQVKEEDDHMVVEIKKADDFMISNTQGDDKLDATNSEESESEATYTELSTVDTLAIAQKETKVPEKPAIINVSPIVKPTVTAKPTSDKNDMAANIVRKAEEIKRKVGPTETAANANKKEKTHNKPENSNTGASDKSLRLLEKELQELKRTNTRTETIKTPAKTIEAIRNRRPQIHTSTPKQRTPAAEEKKIQASTKSPALEKKVVERRVLTKENKEPKDSKEAKVNNVTIKEEKDKDTPTPKAAVKNGNDKSNTEEGVRRSTRPSKIKDYAKMIRDRSQDSDDVNDSDDSADEEYKEIEKSTEQVKPRGRRPSIKPVGKASPPAAPAAAPRKRGRPRKDPTIVPPKVRKEEVEDEGEEEEEVKSDKEAEAESKAKEPVPTKDRESKNATPEAVKSDASKPVVPQKTPEGVLVSPTGQTLKKIPIKALPPGVKPLPLPVNARPVNSGEVCEMQIGKKVVKVQKIVMTKAEVEAMAKKGLVEMKDGTMVLKQGIKIPTSDPAVLKTSLVGDEAGKESPSKKAAPTRCDFGDEP